MNFQVVSGNYAVRAKLISFEIGSIQCSEEIWLRWMHQIKQKRSDKRR